MIQLVTPNLDPIIYKNFGRPESGTVTNWVGWCMGYVSAAFNIFGGSTAHNGQLSTTTFHADRNFPSGVYIVLWFDYHSVSLGYYVDIQGNRTNNWGHVAIYKDGQIWSSPLTNKSTADVFNSIEVLERKYGVKYTGWSEDIANVRVVKEGATMLSTHQARLIYLEYGYEVGGNDPALQNREELELRRGIAAMVMGDRANYQNQINDLNGQVQDLAHKLELAQAGNEDSQILNNFGKALFAIIKRLGLKG